MVSGQVCTRREWGTMQIAVEAAAVYIVAFGALFAVAYWVRRAHRRLRRRLRKRRTHSADGA